MLRILLFHIASTLAAVGFGQYAGGANDGSSADGIQQLDCVPASMIELYGGGPNDGTTMASLEQSSCAIDAFDPIFSGGANDGASTSSILQLECTPPSLDLFFTGGPNDGNASTMLAQSVCPDPTVQDYFHGGPNDGHASAMVEQDICPQPSVVFIFSGGDNDGMAVGAAIPSDCQPTSPIVMWHGGLRDGYSKGINEQTLCAGVTPLPIELLDWSAHCDEGEVLLQWATATESNNAYFLVERSTDHMEWEVVANLEGIGNSASALYYEHRDDRPARVLTYYRLTQVDLDGTRNEYPSVWVECTGATSQLLVYPNPNQGSFSMELIGDDEIQEVLIHSSTGKLMRTIAPRERVLRIDMSDQPSGVYFITARTLHGTNQQKVVIER